MAAIAWAQSSVRQEVQGTAGGSTRATQWGVTETGPCMGWVPSSPQHRLRLEEDAQVTIRVRSHTDTTLVLHGRNENGTTTLCNDDDDGSNPGMARRLSAGSYDLYIGTWDAGDRVPFTMSIDIAAHPPGSNAR